MSLVFRRENLIVSYTADQEGYKGLEKEIQGLKEVLGEGETENVVLEPVFENKNEGFQTSGQVQYVATAGNFAEAGYEYTGALRTGDGFLVSYRDPHLKNTLEVFRKTGDFIRSFDADEREMTKYIIGTISELDAPLTPSAKGSMSLNAWFSGITREDMQKERDEILDAQPEDIRNLAGIVDAIVEQDRICVIGSEEKIQQDKEVFKEIRHLL